MTDARPTAVVVLAAGEGTRMRSATPKVLHGFAGRSLVGHVLAACASLGADRTLVVVGVGRETVAAHLAAVAPAAVPVVQAEQRGTGHALRMALQSAPEIDGTVLVVPADTPLLRAETLRRLVEEHQSSGAVATLLTSVLPDPTGYGRVVRGVAGGAGSLVGPGSPRGPGSSAGAGSPAGPGSPDGPVLRIVEHRDATDEERAIREIGTSVYAFECGPLRDALRGLSTANSQGEEYLTDVVGVFAAAGLPVGAMLAPAEETAGVNDRVQLATSHRTMNERLLTGWMRAGVTVLDPATTWLDVDVVLEPDVTLHPGTQLRGATRVERGAEVGPDSTLVDTVVGAGARVVRAHCEGAEVGPGASVGPFAYLRPGARLGPHAKAGAYVEIKASEIGPGAKVPHLSYVGDATVGAGTNVGAATVVVNYDGVAKHRTTIGEQVRIGSDTMLVAPVTVGDGAYTAAGSVITEDVPPGALAVGRSRQRNVEGWVQRRRPGTPAAEAAAAASAARVPAGQRGAEAATPAAEPAAEVADPAGEAHGADATGNHDGER